MIKQHTSNKKMIISIVIILLVGLVAGYFLHTLQFNKHALSIDQAQTKALDFIKNKLVSPDFKDQVKLKDIVEEDNMYKLTISLGGQEVISYLTKDGEKFFPQAFSIEPEKESQKQSDVIVSQQQDVPDIELFVMSYCPYGTQIEKGILPVVKLLGDKINFDLKFCDYAMHGEKELKEELNQYCINQEQPEKLNDYLSCFLEAGDSTQCLSKNEIDTKKITACVTDADKKYKVTVNFKDKKTWNGNYPTFNVYQADNQKYDVKGSPTLVINGQVIQNAGRDSESLLKTICSAFKQTPKECETQLSTDAPSPGFGYQTVQGSSTANCED